ncbi:SipW-dependent-type signal peptide-containing protein [Caproiciproducens sp.]|uniref:SipW-dependent-type signal peptide-containing protein n=1 Tax=Caproiciproducens sp. TaxID=1954376 RepID=UPI00289BCC9C|nr:SipW-dependent-type signal peptide-containing protein [Caproiciproducens sp.]
MKKRSILTMVVSLVLVGVISVGATMAYLTSKDSHVNTFTVGNVTVAQTEPNWHETDKLNNLVPGVELTKDPTFTVGSTSEDCYVYMKITVPDTTLAGVVSFNVDSTKWDAISGQTIGQPGVYKYKTTVAANGTDKLFTTVTVNSGASSATMAAIANKTITVATCAVQANNLGSTNPDTLADFT